jgi:predicted dienelactone hydrolase
MLADPEFGSRIDVARVGAAGFSYGGYTMLELAGGVGDINEVAANCSVAQPAGSLCASPPEFPGFIPDAIALTKTDPRFRAAMAQSAEPHRDSRIKAVFAIAPALGQTFSPESLAGISIPVEIVAGAGDPIAPPAVNARYLAAHIPHAKLVIWPGGVAHYTFLDTCTTGGKRAQPQLCIDLAGVDRDRVHADTAAQAVAFFDEHLGRY